MNTEKYLNRLEYTGSLHPTLEVLSQLQEAHVLHIPFENLDIHYGVPIELDIDRIYTKIVLDGRGGFCYELNGLFFELLQRLGYNAKRIAARVYDKANGYGPPYDHLAILVEIEGVTYLSDVGFGEFAFSPLRMETGIIQKDIRGEFIIEHAEDNYYRVSKSENGILVPQYIFTTTACELEEFDEMCHYQQTSPHSHFTQNVLVTRPTPGGRITLTKDTLKITNAGSVREIHLETEDAFREMVRKYFGMVGRL